MPDKPAAVEKFKLTSEHRQISKAISQFAKIRTMLQKSMIKQQMDMQQTAQQMSQIDQQFKQLMSAGDQLSTPEVEGQPDLRMQY